MHVRVKYVKLGSPCSKSPVQVTILNIGFVRSVIYKETVPTDYKIYQDSIIIIDERDVQNGRRNDKTS